MSSQVVMSNYTHQTAPTQFVEANGIRFAYRRFGKAGGVPVVFNQHCALLLRPSLLRRDRFPDPSPRGHA